MTSLTQLILEATTTVDPAVKYSLRPGEANALVLTLCVNQNVPDFEEAMDMLQKFKDLSPAEQLALAKRIAEISGESEKVVGYHHVGGPVINLWVRDKKSKEIEFDVLADETTGNMLAKIGDNIIALEAGDIPEPKPYFKEGDL